MNLSPEWVKDFAEHAELSAREAADLLNIPYSEIVNAIESGEISYRKASIAHSQKREARHANLSFYFSDQPRYQKLNLIPTCPCQRELIGSTV